MYSEKWNDLTSSEQQIKVAEYANWERGPKKDIRRFGFGIVVAKNSCWHNKDEENGWQDNPPDFLHDLNAIHEVVNALSDTDYNRFCDILWNICGGASGKTGAINATASQRAEAFYIYATIDRKM